MKCLVVLSSGTGLMVSISININQQNFGQDYINFFENVRPCVGWVLRRLHGLNENMDVVSRMRHIEFSFTLLRKQTSL
jgi:hypothetical protein